MVICYINDPADSIGAVYSLIMVSDVIFEYDDTFMGAWMMIS